MVLIHDVCIGCGVCGALAPTIFKVEGPLAIVIKQPITSEEKLVYQEAKTACPV